MGKKSLIMFGMIFLFGILLLNFAFAQEETIYTCEKIANNIDLDPNTPGNQGGTCIEVTDQSWCNRSINPDTGQAYGALQTSKDQTGYCTEGTCVNRREGTCKGSYQVDCNAQFGIWSNSPMNEVSQCDIGCCAIPGNTPFVGTSITCSYQAGISGTVDYTYDSSIEDDIICIDTYSSTDVEGACVYERADGARTCQRTMKKDCQSDEFYIGQLCSNDNLDTICIETKRTTCYAYDVYYLDSCGNRANIYDSDEYENPNYWAQIYDNAPCDEGDGNKNNPKCGQCEYHAGSICDSSDSITPIYGDNICKSLDCGSYDSNGNGKIENSEKNYKQGEKWCATYSDLSDVSIKNSELIFNKDIFEQNLPGSRYIQLECRDGEVISTECDGYRNTICIEDYYDLNENGKQDTSDYRVAECVPNRWDNCVLQKSKESCLDQTSRDCQWIEGISILKNTDGESLAKDSDGNTIQASCVPSFAPGFDFWDESADSVASCALASQECVVKYEVSWIRNRERALEDKEIEDRISKCVENCYCIPGYKKGMADNKYERQYDPNNKNYNSDLLFENYDDWVASLNLVCSSLGDCGDKLNYVGKSGEKRDDVLDSGNFIKKA
jgi:hypothetical protein